MALRVCTCEGDLECGHAPDPVMSSRNLPSLPKHMVRVTYTYDKVTPESAAENDTSEHGFYMGGGWEYPCPDQDREPERYAEWLADTYHTDMRAREALRDVRHTVGGIDVSHYEQGARKISLYSADPDVDFETGEETRICAHVEAHPRLLAAFCEALGLRAHRTV